MLATAIALAPELAPVTALNDHGLHLPLIERADRALASGENVLDHWVSTWVLGFPVFHYYQHLPHLVVVALHRITGLEAAGLFRLLHWLSLAVFPAAVYVAARWVALPSSAAALAAAAAPLLATPTLYGFDFASYTWRGAGLYTQAWGASFLVLAVASARVTCTTGARLFLTTALLAATFVSHVVYGYFAVLSVVALAFVPAPDAPVGLRLGRIVAALALTIAAIAYFLVPYAIDGAELNRSVWEVRGKYDSYGHHWVVARLFDGELLDAGRLPVLTALTCIGVATAAVRRLESDRVALTLGAVWLALYAGRPTWGMLLDALPLARDVHWHRAIAGVHFAALLFIGLGAHAVWCGILYALRHRAAPIAALVVLVAIAMPAYAERARWLGDNGGMIRRNVDVLAGVRGDTERLVARLRQLTAEQPARVYAGLPGTWGGAFRVGDVPMYALLSHHGFDLLGYAYHAMSRSADIQYHFDDRDVRYYRLLGVGYVVAPSARPWPDFVEPVETIGAWTISRVPSVTLFDVVDAGPAVQTSRDGWYEAAVAWLRGPPHTTCGQVLATQADASRYRATVVAERSCAALFKMTWHSGWRATVDGRAAPTMRMAPSYAGVTIPPGRHEVTFEYRAAPYRTLLVGFGLALLAVLFVWQTRVTAAVDRVTASARRIRLERLRQVVKAVATHAPLLPGVIVAGLPFLQPLVLSGHDAPKYHARLALTTRALAEGELLPRWSADTGLGYGEPALAFAPPLLSYAGSSFHAIGFGVIESVNLTCLALVVIAALGMAQLASFWFGRPAGWVSGTAYVLAPFSLLELYARGDYSEFAAMALAPWALWAVVRAAETRSVGRLIAMALLSAALVLASAPGALILFPMLVVVAGGLALASRDWRVARDLAVGLTLALALSAFFWLPALAEKSLVQSENAISGWYRFDRHFVPARLLWSSPWRYEYNDFPDSGRTMSFAIGSLHLAAVAVALVWLVARARVDRRHRGVVIASLIAAGIAALLATRASAPLWDWIPLLPWLQFPWRFLMVVAAASSLLAAAMCALSRRYAREVAWLAIALFVAAGYPHARSFFTYPLGHADFAAERIRQTRLEITSAREARPRSAPVDPPAPPVALAMPIDGAARIAVTESASARHQLRVEADTDVTLRLNIRDFPGWRATIDGRPAVVDRDARYGLMEVKMPRGSHVVDVAFGLTPVRTGALGVSALALLIIAAWPLRRASRARSRAADPARASSATPPALDR